MCDFKMMDLNIHDYYHSFQNPQQNDDKRKRKAPKQKEDKNSTSILKISVFSP